MEPETDTEITLVPDDAETEPETDTEMTLVPDDAAPRRSAATRRPSTVATFPS